MRTPCRGVDAGARGDGLDAEVLARRRDKLPPVRTVREDARVLAGRGGNLHALPRAQVAQVMDLEGLGRGGLPDLVVPALRAADSRARPLRDARSWRRTARADLGAESRVLVRFESGARHPSSPVD